MRISLAALSVCALSAAVSYSTLCYAAPSVGEILDANRVASGGDAWNGKATFKETSDYVGQGYGLPTEGMVEAVKMFARLEGILLDPVYTGKAAAGLVDLVRKGKFACDSNVVFLHTGGSAGLFGYPDAFDFPPAR